MLTHMQEQLVDLFVADPDVGRIAQRVGTTEEIAVRELIRIYDILGVTTRIELLLYSCCGNRSRQQREQGAPALPQVVTPTSNSPENNADTVAA